MGEPDNDAVHHSTTFIVVSSLRVAVSLVGMGIIVVFKMRQGIKEFYEQDKAGLPMNKGVTTLWYIGKLSVSQPNKGVWLVGHVLCMLSSLLSTSYLCWAINNSNDLYKKNIGPAATARAFGTFFSIPLIALQLLLVVFGQYGYHRWVGRVLVQLWFFLSLITIILFTNNSQAFWILLGIFSLEMTFYLILKWYFEDRTGKTKESAQSQPEKETKLDLETGEGLRHLSSSGNLLQLDDTEISRHPGKEMEIVEFEPGEGIRHLSSLDNSINLHNTKNSNFENNIARSPIPAFLPSD